MLRRSRNPPQRLWPRLPRGTTSGLSCPWSSELFFRWFSSNNLLDLFVLRAHSFSHSASRGGRFTHLGAAHSGGHHQLSKEIGFNVPHALTGDPQRNRSLTFFWSSSQTLARGVISWTSLVGDRGKLAGGITLSPVFMGLFLKVHLAT